MDNLSEFIKAEQEEQTEFEKEVFEYLDALRESGITNMFGAAPYIAKAFDISMGKARILLVKWMENFGK